jgi:Ni,Fe-hydrogenase III large subunit
MEKLRPTSEVLSHTNESILLMGSIRRKGKPCYVTNNTLTYEVFNLAQFVRGLNGEQKHYASIRRGNQVKGWKLITPSKKELKKVVKYNGGKIE